MALCEGRGYSDVLLPSVRQWIDWKLTGVLPRAGGTLDQYPEFMQDLRTILPIESSMQDQKASLDKVKAELKGIRDGKKPS